MNAGVSGRYLSEIVRSVIAYEDGELKTYSKEDCGYSYKHSRFMNGGVILGTILDLKESTSEQVERDLQDGDEQRAIGTFDWPDGDQSSIFMTRP